jgi:PAS domain-containing protein
MRHHSCVNEASGVLTEARQLAVRAAALNIAVFLVDARGRLEYYNAAAEAILGQPFDEVGQADLDEQGARWDPRNAEGERIPLEHLPGMDAVRKRRPVHRFLNTSGADGAHQRFEASAFPLMDDQGELMGAVGFFWATS